MLSIFANMFRTATLNDWDAPAHWKRHDLSGDMGQQQRDAEEWRRRILRDTCRLR